MSCRSPARVVLLVLPLVLFVLAAGAAAQNTAALMNEALDKQVAFQLKDVPLPAALQQIEAKTGVPLKADPAVYDLLPWGENTLISADVRNGTLRQALGAVTRKLGLTFGLGDEAVYLRPTPALRRCPERPTVQELRALDLLAATPMPAAADKRVGAIVAAVDMGLDKLQSPVAVENRLGMDARNLNGLAVDVPRNATMLDALEAVAKQTPATWYPWDRGIVVVPKETQVRDQLTRKTFTAHYNGVELAQVLEDLRRRSGVDFAIEPGALQKVPEAFRTVKAFWDNVSVAQAMESLRGVTGLDYAVTDQGVTISNPTPAANAAAGGPGAADPVVATMTLENGLVVFIRESQVPPELRAFLRQRVQAQMDSLRALAKQPAAASATQPGGK